MKKLKQFIFPVAIALIGTGAALATSSSEDSVSLVEKGYRLNPSTQQCEITTVDCTNLPGIACTWTSGGTEHPLFRLDPSSQTMCGIRLNKI